MKVRDAMKPSNECVGPNDTAAAAQEVIHRTEPDEVAVLDHKSPTGVVGERELEERIPDGRPLATVRVREVMNSVASSAHPEEDLMDAEQRMVAQGLSSMPVLEDGKLIGIVKLTK